MATVGTITENFSVHRTLVLNIQGVTNGNNCPPFRAQGFPFGTIQVVVTGTAPTAVQLQGSNDSTNPPTNWSNLGTAASSFPAMSPLTVLDESPAQWYQFTVSGGDGTTSVNAMVVLSGSKA